MALHPAGKDDNFERERTAESGCGQMHLPVRFGLDQLAVFHLYVDRLGISGVPLGAE